MIVKGTKQLGSFKRGINLYIPKKVQSQPPPEQTIWKIAIFSSDNFGFHSSDPVETFSLNMEYIWDGETLFDGKPIYVGTNQTGPDLFYPDIVYGTLEGVPCYILRYDGEAVFKTTNISSGNWTNLWTNEDNSQAIAPYSEISYNQNDTIQSITINGDTDADGTYILTQTEPAKWTGPLKPNSTSENYIIDNENGTFTLYGYFSGGEEFIGLYLSSGNVFGPWVLVDGGGTIETKRVSYSSEIIWKVAIFGAGTTSSNAEYIWNGIDVYGGKPFYFSIQASGNNELVFLEGQWKIYDGTAESIIYASSNLNTWSIIGSGSSPAPSSALSYSQDSFISSITLANGNTCNGTYTRISGGQTIFLGPLGSVGEFSIQYEFDDVNWSAALLNGDNEMPDYVTSPANSVANVNLMRWYPNENAGPVPVVSAVVYTSLPASDILLDLDANQSSSYNITEGGNTWFDLALPSNNVTFEGEPEFIPGGLKYFSFNGSNQYGTSTGETVPSTAYTKCVWFRLNSLNSPNNLVSSDVGGHFMYFASSNKMYCGHSDWQDYGAYPSITSFGTNIWYFAVLTFNTTDGMKLYINGELDSTYTDNKNAHPGDGSTNIATYDGNNLLNGDISIVKTYNRALSAQEVLNIYNNTKDIFPSTVWKIAIFGAGSSEFNGEYIWDGTTLVNGKPTYIGPSPYDGNNAYISWDSDNNIWNFKYNTDLLYQSINLTTWTRPSGGGDEPVPSSVLSYNQNSFINSITYSGAYNNKANGTFTRSSEGNFTGNSGSTVDSIILYDEDEGNLRAFLQDNQDGVSMYVTDIVSSSSNVNLFKWNPNESSSPTPQVTGLTYSE